MNDVTNDSVKINSPGFNDLLSRNTLPTDMQNINTGLMGSSNISQLKTLINAKKPTPSDYNRMNQAFFTYASATTITVTSIDATKFFQISDKLHIVQSGTDKYFYVVAVTSTLLTITGGSDYTLANATITTIELSRLATPLGFPVVMNYDCNPQGVGTASNFSLGTGQKLGRFLMIGKEVFFEAGVVFATMNSGDGVKINLPVGTVTPIGTNTVADRMLCQVTDNFTDGLGSGKIDITPYNVLTLYNFPAFTGFSATVNGFGFYIKYFYRMD